MTSESYRLAVKGERTSGDTIRTQNGMLVTYLVILVTCCVCTHTTVMGAASIANIVKSSLGPVGLDKMLVDDIGVDVWPRGPTLELKSCTRFLNQLNFNRFL